VRSAKYAGARTILVNMEPSASSDDSFDQEILGPAEEILPVLLAGE
jgi:NAD-dependent deacetylase